MKKTRALKITFIIIAILMLTLAFFQPKVLAYDGVRLASSIVNPDDYDPGSFKDAFKDSEKITNLGSTIITVIRVIGIVVTVVVLMILGIKYMTGSVQEKADYKKSMLPYLIGVFIFFSLSQIIPVIIDLVGELNA